MCNKYLYNNDNTDSKLNNSTTNQTNWFNPNGIFMLGSFNDSYFWGTPFKAKIGDPSYHFVYPMLLLNSVEYLGCLYSSLSEYITVFLRAFSGSTSYLGAIRISTKSLAHTIYKCNSLTNGLTSTPATTSTVFYRSFNPL